jgi:hypothetical protein
MICLCISAMADSAANEAAECAAAVATNSKWSSRGENKHIL